MSVTLSKSSSSISVNEDSPTKETPTKAKKEKHALTHRFTKLSLFGRKHRVKYTQSTTLSKESIQEYLSTQSSSSVQEQDEFSVCDEEGVALILWEEDGNVKAATFVMLIRRITDEKFVDSNLSTDVIVSYHIITKYV